MLFTVVIGVVVVSVLVVRYSLPAINHFEIDGNFNWFGDLMAVKHLKTLTPPLNSTAHKTFALLSESVSERLSEWVSE